MKEGAHGRGESAGTETDCLSGGRAEEGGEQKASWRRRGPEQSFGASGGLG